AVLGLDEMQQRQQRRSCARVACDDLFGVALQPRGHLGRKGGGPVDRRARLVGSLTQLEEDAHLSTPPITGSSEATAAIASATMPPSHIAATACRFVNDGSR